MVTTTSPMAMRIAQRLKETGRTASAVSRAADLGPDYLRDFIKGRKKSMTVDGMAKVARELGVTVPWLQGDDSALPEPAGQPHTEARPRNVPVFGTAAGAFAGALHITTDVIEWLPCPPGLTGARDAYALYVIGDSMEPRFRHGDPIFVSPHRPVRPGDDVVLQIRHEAGGPTESWVKEFVRIDGDRIVTRQHNPQQEVVFERGQVVEMHRVVPMKELIGM